MHQPADGKIPETYRSPTLKKLQPGEAKRFLLEHAQKGDQGAREILQLILPASNDKE